MVVESEVFSSTRKKLDVLGYREPLGEESLPLVGRLLDDLILATHGLREGKRESTSKRISELEEQCVALKAENTTLKDECQCLNKNILQIHESYKAQIQELSERSRSLESANNDLQTLNFSCMERLQTLELELNQSVKLTNKHARINASDTPGPRLNSSHKNPDLDGLSNSNPNPAPNCPDSQTHPYICCSGKSLNEPANAIGSDDNAVVKTLNKRCSDLEANILLLQKERELIEKRTATLRKQIEVRNEEIDRLRRIVKGEITPEKLVPETQQGHADWMIGQLQTQVDLLQKRNEELEKRMFLRLDAISQSAFAVSSRRERASQCELLKHSMGGKVDRCELAELLGNFEKTSSHFLSWADELLNCQKKMVLEIERLKRLVPQTKKPTQPVNRRAVRAAIKKPSSSSATFTGINAASAAKQRTDDYEPPIKEYVEGLLADRETLRIQVDYLNRNLRRWFTTDAAFITATNDATEGGNQNAHTQSVNFDASNGDRERDEASVGHEFTLEMNPKNDTEFETIKQERDELQIALNQFEQNLLKIQAEVRALRSERDQLLLELEKAEKREASSKRPIFHTEFTVPDHAQALDHQLKNGTISSPDASLHVRVSTETGRLSQHSCNEQQQLREEVSALQAALADSRTQLEDSRRHTDELELQVEQLKCKVEQMTSQKEEVEKLKEQLQAALVQTNARNSSLVSELAMRKNMCNEALRGKQLSDAMVAQAQCDLQSLNTRVMELDAEIKCSHEEVSRLRKVASQLDAEKDALQTSLDDRTEDLVTLKRDLDQRTQLFEENKQYLNSVELRLRQVTAMAAERDREVQTLTERLRKVETSTQVVARSRDISEEKYAKAKEDITVLSNEVDSLKTHLQATKNENSELHCRLAEALQNVSSSDQALDAKLKEHQDLLVQYGFISKEFEAMSKRNMELERTLAEVEEALQGKEAAVRNHIDRAQKAEFAALSAKRERVLAEEKCVLLSTAAEKAESRVQELDGEMAEVRRDLAATRDLAGALQARLDNAAGQAVSTASDLTAKLAECERKLHDALDETAHQKEIIQQLELLLAVARENQIRLQDSLDRKTEECERLRKHTHSARQGVGVVTTDAMMLHNQFSTHPRCAGSTGASATSVTEIAIPPACGEDHPLLFYKPLHPTPSSSSTVSIPLQSNHVVTAVSSAATTPKGSPTCRPVSSGANKSSIRFYESLNASESCSINPSST